ncbi:hypothetical protein OPIT5_00090 (plasmid) [Opitutaceae bacterium TAV5]|nr:hypothetical protein OPIT5_00090 [Opitutaceae bacterium TAV5]
MGAALDFASTLVGSGIDVPMGISVFTIMARMGERDQHRPSGVGWTASSRLDDAKRAIKFSR